MRCTEIPAIKDHTKEAKDFWHGAKKKKIVGHNTIKDKLISMKTVSA